MKKILQRVSCRSSTGFAQQDFSQSDDIYLEIDYSCDHQLAGAGFIVSNVEGVRIGSFNTYMAFLPPHKIPNKGQIVTIQGGDEINRVSAPWK